MKAWSILWRVVAACALAGMIVVGTLILARERGWSEPASRGGPATMRLITAEQYGAIVHDLFGEDIAVQVSFPPLQRRQGLLALGASDVVMTPGALEQFEAAARAVAAQVVDDAHRPISVPCTPARATGADASCAGRFFTRVGRHLYRRPLTDGEVAFEVATAGAASQKLGDFYRGLAYGLAGMLTSPKFLYFTEVTEPDPDHPGLVRLDAYSKATRLSLFLWNAAPDTALLNAAYMGELHERKGLERQIERMLNSPMLEQGVRTFFADLLGFDKFDTLAKDPVIYPAFTRSVGVSAKEQALRLITDHLLTRQGDYRDLFTTSRTFVDGTLAPIYTAPVSDPRQWIPYDLHPDRSAGLLTSLSFAALYSHPGRSSPTRRGRAIRELLLCQKVPDPPPNVNFNIIEDPGRKFKNARERLQAHSTDPTCAGCHKLTDPTGLALENFDGAGAFRDEESGAPIDTSGALDGQPFKDVASMGQAMRAHPALGPCLASRLYAYAIGRELAATDRPWLAYFAKRFAVHGYRVPDLLGEIVRSSAFYAVSQESEKDGDAAAPLSTVAAINVQESRSLIRRTLP